jgi:hypothetical protein
MEGQKGKNKMIKVHELLQQFTSEQRLVIKDISGEVLAQGRKIDLYGQDYNITPLNVEVLGVTTQQGAVKFYIDKNEDANQRDRRGAWDDARAALLEVGRLLNRVEQPDWELSDTVSVQQMRIILAGFEKTYSNRK